MTEKAQNKASNEVRELSDAEMTRVAGGFHYVLSGGFGSRPPARVPYNPNAPFNPPTPFGPPIAGGPINEPGGSGWD